MDNNLIFDSIKFILATSLAWIIQYALKSYYEKGPRVIHYLLHASVNQVSFEGQPSFPVWSHGLVVRNVGDKPAHNVKIYNAHMQGLYHFSIWPEMRFDNIELPNGGKEICVSILRPSEQITLSYLYSPPVAAIQFGHSVKHDEGLSKEIRVIPAPIPSFIQLLVYKVLAFIGLSTVIYLAIGFAQMYLHGYVR